MRNGVVLAAATAAIFAPAAAASLLRFAHPAKTARLIEQILVKKSIVVACHPKAFVIACTGQDANTGTALTVRVYKLAAHRARICVTAGGGASCYSQHTIHSL